MAAIVASSAGAAFADDNVVALLPLDSSNAKGIDAATQNTLEEDIRTVTGDVLSPLGYTVLTGETTLAVLSDNGIDSKKACEASCALEAARELKARLFISGSVNLSEGLYVAFVRLFDSQNGRQLASVKCEGEKVRDLRAQFEQRAPAFFEKALKAGAPVPPAPAKAAPAPVAKVEPPVEAKVEPAPAKAEPPVEAKVEPVVVKEEPPVEKPAAGAKLGLTVRLGLGATNGVLGLGLEKTLFDVGGGSVSVAVGSGTYALALGLGWVHPAGGLYVNAGVVSVAPGLLPTPDPIRARPGNSEDGPFTAGFATIGYEVALGSLFSIKAGAGVAYNGANAQVLDYNASATPDLRSNLGLVGDLSVGVVL